MELILTPANITFFIGILSVIFSVFLYFKKPQDKIELEQALTDKEVSSKATVLAQKEMENKANILAQQVQWEKEANEKKFVEMGLKIDSTMTLAQNHIHSIDVKVDNLATVVGVMNNLLTKVITIIDERIPSKK